MSFYCLLLVFPNYGGRDMRLLRARGPGIYSTAICETREDDVTRWPYASILAPTNVGLLLIIRTTRDDTLAGKSPLPNP
jgi:hypothetical protein